MNHHQKNYDAIGGGELKQAEPKIFALLAGIWGPLPGIPPVKSKGKP